MKYQIKFSLWLLYKSDDMKSCLRSKLFLLERFNHVVKIVYIFALEM